MLRSLHIRDMLIIDRLELEFHAGLNVLTGETGAGKSILLDSLGFVLGWRGRADLVRTGADQGEVTAVFELGATHPGRAVLEEAGLPVEDDLILRRVNGRDGRKTAWINDRRASGEVLRRLSETLVELHGQHDDRGLLNPSGHRGVLDDFASHGDLLTDAAQTWRALSSARKALGKAETDLAAMREEEDFLRHAVAEFDALSPEQGEEAALDAARRQMQAGQRIREDIQRGLEGLGPNGAEGVMGDAMRWLDGVVGDADGMLDAPIAALGRAFTELGEAVQGVETCLDALDFEPGKLEDTEERLFALRALARKHQIFPDDLPGLGDVLRARLEALDSGDADIARLRADTSVAEQAYVGASAALTKSRQEAAKRLDAAVTAELAPLKMERAQFMTDISPATAGPDGVDQVGFTVATNPGAPAGPIAKIASGGELSRFLLALKVCLSAPDGGATMIFDEIDRGVGGATADAVGRRLASLSDGAQVLVVTHSPQVAALGAHHWRVEKRVTGDMTLSTVTPLSPPDRIDEIARMISGDRITDEARAAAKSLLAG